MAIRAALAKQRPAGLNVSRLASWRVIGFERREEECRERPAQQQHVSPSSSRKSGAAAQDVTD
jgi:hypothetical protein